MDTKNFFESKLFYVGLLQVLIGVSALLSEFFTAGIYDASAITLLVSGVLTIVLRVFFTDTPINH